MELTALSGTADSSLGSPLLHLEPSTSCARVAMTISGTSL